jgi:thiol:disulfide interchange protein
MSEQQGSMLGALMPKFAVGLLVALVGFAGHEMFGPHTVFAADGTDPGWDALVTRASRDRKPAVVLFTANWCPACRGLWAGALASTDVQTILRSERTLVVVDMTVPTPLNQARSKAFGVTAIPTMIRFDDDGRETGRTHGMSAAEMVKWLRN